MKSTISADLLSAASLLTTCVGLLFTTWHQSIAEAIDKDQLVGTAKTKHATYLRQLMWCRAVPLAASSIMLAAVLLWPLKSVIFGIRFWHSYDPVAACFVVVYLVIWILVLSTARTVIKLRQRKKALD